MTKKIKIGLSAMVAFAFMFATSVSVVAQEKVNASDRVEVKESVQTNYFAKHTATAKDNIASKVVDANDTEIKLSDKQKPSEEDSFQAPYFYIGPVTSDITILQNLDHWSETPDDENFECAGSAQVPCSILATSEPDLNNKLQNCDDLQEVMTASTGSRADL